MKRDKKHKDTSIQDLMRYNQERKKKTMNIINISLSVEELKTIVDCMGDYLNLHISSNYEVEEVKERLNSILSIYEGK